MYFNKIYKENASTNKNMHCGEHLYMYLSRKLPLPYFSGKFYFPSCNYEIATASVYGDVVQIG